jgi:hypothetical protein
MTFENVKSVKEFVRTVIEYGFWAYVNFLAIDILD